MQIKLLIKSLVACASEDKQAITNTERSLSLVLEYTDEAPSVKYTKEI